MTLYGFKTLEVTEAPVITERKVKAVIGCVDVVDNENEMIVSESYKIGRIRCSRWLHNSMPLAKQRGLINDIEEPVGYGDGLVDGDRIIGEVDVMKGARGDDFLDHVRAAGDALGYSHGFKIERRQRRSDGVTLLHGAWTTEMSPVPDPASPGTGTLAALLGMKLDVNGQPISDFIDSLLQNYLDSEEFADQVRRAIRGVAYDIAWSQAWDVLWDQMDREEMKSADASAFRELFVKHLLEFEAGKPPAEATDNPTSPPVAVMDSWAVLRNILPVPLSNGA